MARSEAASGRVVSSYASRQYFAPHSASPVVIVSALLHHLALNLDAPGSQELAKVAKVVVLRVQIERLLITRDVTDGSSIAVVSDMVGSTLLVEENVPVRPAARSSIKIANDIVAVTLGGGVSI